MLTDYTPETFINKLYDKFLRILKSKTTKLIIIITSLIGLLFCILILIPQIQNIIINITETKLLQRELRDIGKWKDQLNLVGIVYIASFITFMFFITENKVNIYNYFFKYLFILIYVFYLVFISVFSYRHGWQWINSDHASEMMLGKLLAEENALLSRSWYYSTEIRLVYQTLFTMPLFKILVVFENWALIRSLNILLNNIILILSYVFMAKQMNIRPKYILITSILIILPFSFLYWDVVLFGGYYVFFIAQHFFCLGLLINLLKHTGNIKNIITSFIFFTVLSLLMGIQTIRSLYCIYIPLLLTCIYFYFKHNKKDKFVLFLGCYGFIVCCIGFIINNLLHFFYQFKSFHVTNLDNLQANFIQKLILCLTSLVNFFGYNFGINFLSIKGLLSFAVLIGTYLLFFATFKIITIKPENISKNTTVYKFLPVYFLTSVVFNFFINIILDHGINDMLPENYFIPFMILYIPLIAVFFSQKTITGNGLKRSILFLGILIVIFGQSVICFQGLARYNKNTVRNGHIQYLLDNQLYYGYATFWEANVVTELTNGKIEINGLFPFFEQIDESKKLLNWNWLKPHRYNYTEPDYQKREPFLLLAKWEAYSIGYNLPQSQPDYEDENYIIIKYPASDIFLHDIPAVR